MTNEDQPNHEMMSPTNSEAVRSGDWLGEAEAALATAKERVAYYAKHPDEYCSREQWIIEAGRWERRIAELRSPSPSDEAHGSSGGKRE